jgi:hypothetical protein
MADAREMQEIRCIRRRLAVVAQLGGWSEAARIPLGSILDADEHCKSRDTRRTAGFLFGWAVSRGHLGVWMIRSRALHRQESGKKAQRVRPRSAAQRIGGLFCAMASIEFFETPSHLSFQRPLFAVYRCAVQLRIITSGRSVVTVIFAAIAKITERGERNNTGIDVGEIV